LPTSSALRPFAEDPAAWGELDPAFGFERVLTGGYCLLFGPDAGFTQVSRLRLDPDDVAETLHEVRGEVAQRDRRRVTWNIGSSATPADLVDRLTAHGLVGDDHLAALVVESPPPAPPEGVEARRVRDLEEFELAEAIAATVFGDGDVEDGADARFERERAGHGPRTYVAFVDGLPVGSARMFVQDGDPAGVLVGGAVLPGARGRGAYRGLVRARWDDAVALGFGALCVQAGPLSRPILERLGFEKVAEVEVLLDPATC
jgi:hypothetical protein